MANDRFVIAMIAGTMYEEELARKLGINPHSEYGRKRLNEYLEEERKSDELSAKIHLHNSNPGKFFSYTEIRREAAKIKRKRLEPYVEKAKRLQKEQQEISNTENIQTVFTKEKVMERLQKTRKELAIQHDDLCDQYDELAQKLKIKSTAKTRTEKIQDKVSIKIELKKLENRIEVLSRIIDAYDTKISFANLNVNMPSSEVSISTIETSNKKLLQLLEKEYEKLDVLSTKMVLASEFKTERLKGLDKYDFGPFPMLVGFISVVGTMAFFPSIFDLPFTLTNLSLLIGIPFFTGTSATSLIMSKSTKQKKQVFDNLNNLLGEESLADELPIQYNTFKEYAEFEQLVDSKIQELMIILMDQKEHERLIEISTETSKSQFDLTQSLGRNSVENIINDTAPFPDKILRPVGFAIPKSQSDISCVEPYLVEDIETDEMTNSEEQSGHVLIMKPTKPGNAGNK